MKLVGIVMEYNESSRGNLRRCLDNMKLYCDEIVVYDDGSTDDSVAVAQEYTKHIIASSDNDFMAETEHRQMLVDYANALKADYIFWLDADEVLDRNGTKGIRDLCHGPSYGFREVTLWRSDLWKRTDYLGSGWFTRLWKNTGHLRIPPARGLHKQLHPDGLEVIPSKFEVIHFGYATKEAIERRWRERSALGVSVIKRKAGIDERNMVLERISLATFPPGIEIDNETKMPTPIKYHPDIMKEAGLE